LNSLTDAFTLANGVKIPCVGLGTWQTPDGQVAVDSVYNALQAGYRHIDTAAIYGNEVSVGKAVAKSGIPRKDLFVTSKVWNTDRGYEKTLAAFDQTMRKLNMDYLDLYLIHWPAVSKQFKDWQQINQETWKAMEKLYEEKRIRAIGVSNFLPHHLEPLMKTAAVMPIGNQIEYHPGQIQKATVDFCKKNNILVEAWSPLGTGKMLTNWKLNAIAEKYTKSTAQLCIRWALQNGILPLPKSVTKSRIIENTGVFDFTITPEDMKLINDMPYFAGSGHNPDEVKF
jgi:diketogulonate reductase-like aldo/keto reductase